MLGSLFLLCDFTLLENFHRIKMVLIVTVQLFDKEHLSVGTSSEQFENFEVLNANFILGV